MNIDPSTPTREVLIRYLENSGVNQQKEAAELLRMDERVFHFILGMIPLKVFEHRMNVEAPPDLVDHFWAMQVVVDNLKKTDETNYDPRN